MRVFVYSYKLDLSGEIVEKIHAKTLVEAAEKISLAKHLSVADVFKLFEIKLEK